MKCIKCGSELKEQDKYCPNCGEQFIADIDLWEGRLSQNKTIKKKPYLSGKIIRGIGFLIIGVSLIVTSIFSRFSWYSDNVSDAVADTFGVWEAATDMENIRSISGDSIDEAYYQDMGVILINYYTNIIDINYTLMRTWQMLNSLCIYGGFVILVIGISGLRPSRKME